MSQTPLKKEDTDRESLGNDLKKKVDPLFLRRMKEDNLEGLPNKIIIKHSSEQMLEAQLNRYLEIVKSAKSTSSAENIKLSSGALTGTLTDLDTDSLFAYGFKTGHYFESIPWFGVEFNFSQSDPDISKQTGTATGTIGVFTAAATGQGSIDVDYVNTFGFLAMFRATEEQAKDMFNIQPYLGLGVGINQVSLGTGRVFSAAGVESDSVDLGEDTDVGFLLSAGLNYVITDHIKAYSEYKYTSGEFEATTDGVKYALDYDASSLMFGAAYSL